MRSSRQKISRSKSPVVGPGECGETRHASNRTFRLEVVKVEKGTADVHFDVHYYERQTLYKAPDGTITAKDLAGVPQFTFGFQMVCRGLRLQQALDWLAERRNNQNTDWHSILK
jgi:hypothetical protein